MASFAAGIVARFAIHFSTTLMPRINGVHCAVPTGNPPFPGIPMVSGFQEFQLPPEARILAEGECVDLAQLDHPPASVLRDYIKP